MNKVKLLASIIIVQLLASCVTEENKGSRSATTREKTQHGVTFSVKQLSSDQVDAFYIGRGFSKQQIKTYTQTCVYMAVLRNNKAPGRIHFLRNSWKVNNNGKEFSIKENSQWLTLFKEEKVSASSLIAFRLAQLPEEQEYDPNGDWNQGMLSVNVPTGSTFDISVRWDIKEKPYELTLKEVHCAKQTAR